MRRRKADAGLDDVRLMAGIAMVDGKVVVVGYVQVERQRRIARILGELHTRIWIG